MNILAVSIHDLRLPLHGSARLVLSSLGAMALAGHDVAYLGAIGRGRERVQGGSIVVRSGPRKAMIESTAIHDVGLGGLNADPTSSIFANARPDIVLCEDRRLMPLSLRLSRRYRVPLVLRLDGMRHLYYKDVVAASANGIRAASLTPPALAFYTASILASSAAIAVSKDIESRMRGPLFRKVRTVEPTFMLLDATSDMKGNAPVNPDELPSPLVLCSCPAEMNVFMARMTPEVNYVVTGPRAFYTREYSVAKFGTVPQNLILLHNVSDSTLERLHAKVMLAAISRQALTGISMTLIEALCSGRPILTDTTTMSRVQNLSREMVKVVDDYFSWPVHVRCLLDRPDVLSSMGEYSLAFFRRNLSPPRHSEMMSKVFLDVARERETNRS